MRRDGRKRKTQDAYLRGRAPLAHGPVSLVDPTRGHSMVQVSSGRVCSLSLPIPFPMQDPVRKKNVADTPEERVRQAVVAMLSGQRGIPMSLMAVEKGIRVQQEMRRPDIVVYDRGGQPWMIVECKAPGVPISQETLNQAANYNRTLDAPYLFVTNGTDHRCAYVRGDRVSFLETLPEYPSP